MESARRRPRLAFAALLSLLWLATPALAAGGNADLGGYQLGSGWTVPDTDLTLGGYASGAVSKDGNQPWSLDARHLSLFLWWQNQSRLSFFSEADLENALQIRSERTSTDGAYLALERLYADWTQSDALHLRIGKFLTPIGRWNLVHAAPLVWTTSRPLITEYSFPGNTTGGMAYGTLSAIGNGLDYSLYGSVGKELRANPHEDVFTEAYGLHLSYPLQPSLQLGFSFANFEQRWEIGNHKNLVGLDLLWSRNGYELSAEADWRFSNGNSLSDQKGAFVQGVAPLGGRFFAVTRYEYFQPSGAGTGTSLWLGGVDYRWNRSLVIKTELNKTEHHLDEAPSGFRASIAVLF